MTTSTDTRQYWRGLDLLKFILAFFIVAAHCRLAEECPHFKERLDVLFSIAVPLYFAISSFLFRKKLDCQEEEQKPRLIKHYLFRLSLLFCVWYCLSFPVTFHHWWKVASLKETLFAILLGCTAMGYWFIKALGVNLLLLYLFRKKTYLIILLFLSLVVYLIFAYNYIFNLFYFPYRPYYSFYYHTAYCCVGAYLARSPQALLFLERNSPFLILGWFLVFVATQFVPLSPVFRLASIVLVFPCFSKLTNGRELKYLRNISTIIYMSQFIVIYYYDCLCKVTSPILCSSPIRFFIVSALCLAVASASISLEKRRPIFKYLR